MTRAFDDGGERTSEAASMTLVEQLREAERHAERIIGLKDEDPAYSISIGDLRRLNLGLETAEKALKAIKSCYPKNSNAYRIADPALAKLRDNR